MSTRASIKFIDGEDEIFIYRHCDGYPEEVKPDLDKLLDTAKGRWSEPDIYLLATLFLAINYDIKDRLPNYELTSCIHGDEEYFYTIKWDKEKKAYLIDIAGD